MNLKYLNLILIIFVFSISNAQISTREKPVSYFKSGQLNQTIPIKQMPVIDINKLLDEDKFDEEAGDIPWRFGKDINVNFNLYNSGSWYEFENGDRLWRLNIVSKGACSINLIYDYFDIPDGAKLYVYNEERTDEIGAFTSSNVKKDKTFATFPVKGESVIVEYFEPSSVSGLGEISISKVIHAYKDLFGKLTKGYGSSGSCNNNVNCPEGEPWQNEKRSVAMILLSNNSRICSGALINNINQDGTPYFLTANHCLGGENTWIIMFNYESLTCENQDGTTSQTIQNTTLLASNPASDFALVELSVNPPADYYVYYSGWTRYDTASQQSVGIHHPSGDIKKISFDYDPLISSDYAVPYLAHSHWKVEVWDDGTTEGGSSGSPLYDPNHRIVGQLHGGWASCTNLAADFYGKFSLSWDYGTTSSSRLKDWLDTDNTNVMTLDGWDPRSSNLDAGITRIIDPQPRYCGNDSFSINPKIEVKNIGLMKIDTLSISYTINSIDTCTFVYTDSIHTNEIDTIVFPEITLVDGEHTFTTFIKSVNNLPDENNLNDTLAVNFNVINNPTYLNFDFFSGDLGKENDWKLEDTEGNILYNEDDIHNNVQYNEAFCLDTGCYVFTLHDDGNNGLSENAYYNLVFPVTNYIIYSGGDFESEEVTDFCIYETPVANFQVLDSINCLSEEIQFFNNSVGELYSEWFFEGGNPELSFERNPLVSYNSTGEYSVKLKVHGTLYNDSLVLENYISINSLPSISFTVVSASDSISGDGMVTANATGGLAPYTYCWNNGSSSNTLNNISFGWYYLTVTDAIGCSSSDSVYINVNYAEQLETGSGVMIYPTITDGTLNIKSKPNKIRMYEICDIYGKIIIIEQNPAANTTLTLSSIKKGLYFIRFYAENEIITKKFVLK